MRRIIISAAIFVMTAVTTVFAAQLQTLRIVPNDRTVGVIHADSAVRVEWIALAGAGSQTPSADAPPEADVYVARHPGGGDLSRYTRLTNIRRRGEGTLGTSAVETRFVEFTPSAQGTLLRPGTYYAIVATVNEDGETHHSDYLNLMIESPRPPNIIQPRANFTAGQSVARINDPSPLFRWTAGDAGVPYYHVILSDEAIVDAQGNPNPNLNVIWQAITPNTSIQYGAPDPSGTITATPPPLTPGKQYSWMVLNNYGNHMAFTSNVFNAVDLMFGQFIINGEPISPPRVVEPNNGAEFSYSANPTIEFAFTNIDTRANSYLINLFSLAAGDGLGISGLGDISAGLLIWEQTVARGNLGAGDTMRVSFPAAATLTGGDYVWRVHALDSRGAASTGDLSSGRFEYRANAGEINIIVSEFVGGYPFPVGYAELSVDVISGPSQAPLAFFTDASGRAARSFPTGTYRITASREGFIDRSATITVTASQIANVNIMMTRPEAVLFGQALSASDNSALNHVRVTAVSDWGDTLSTLSDGSGNYTLNLRAATWNIHFDKAGYRSPTPIRTTLRAGDNRELSAVRLARNPFTLSGIVRNEAGSPLIGARVRVLTREGMPLDELASTPQSGAFSFHLAAGSYILTAELAGFVMFSRNIDIAGSRHQDVTMRGGAVLVNGSVLGVSYIPDAAQYVERRAPVASARVRFWEEGARDTFTVRADATFGNFSISLPENREYKVLADAAGFDPAGYSTTFSTDSELGASRTFSGELRALAMIRGAVRAGGVGLDEVDVFVYDANNNVAASGRTDAAGVYEIRGIPDGRYTAGAGRRGYFTTTTHNLNIAGGRPTTANGGAVSASYDFAMNIGDKTVTWVVDNENFADGGAINVISPIRISVPLARGTATLDGAGHGRFIVEADPGAGNPALLTLARREFTVSQAAAAHTENILFLVEHNSPDTLEKIASGANRGSSELGVVIPYSGERVTRLSLFHRTEGSLRYARVDAPETGGNIPLRVNFTPDRDGANLEYYFEVEMENGDIYGSSRQTFFTFARPDPSVITKLEIVPGAAGDDVLTLPSSYAATFAFEAFVSDAFNPLPNSFDYGRVRWELFELTDNGNGDGNRRSVGGGSGRTYSFTTSADRQDFLLTARLSLGGTDFSMKDGVDSVITIPLHITGSALDNMFIRRQGNEGPIISTGVAEFSLEAFDAEGRPVTVTPTWDRYPPAAGTITTNGGVFEPRRDYFGNVRILAAIGGSRPVEYVTELGAAGQDVRYVLRHRDSRDTARTSHGQAGIIFLSGAVGENETVEFGVTVPDLNNLVHRGTEVFRMADSVAFEIEMSDPDLIRDDRMLLMFEIPERLRGAARDGQDFAIARWSSEDLKWIPLATSEVTDNGAAVVAALTNNFPDDETARASARLANSQSRTGDLMSAASALSINASARYALVTRSRKLDANVTVSPHPFSPFIVPVREHGHNAFAGTRIRVDIDAPEAFVRSVQVHIYNATGQRVWAIIDQSATAGANDYWWNGRTSGRGGSRSSVSEEVWESNEVFLSRTENRPLVRNGRYFVTVIVTDSEGGRRRLMRPVVVLK